MIQAVNITPEGAVDSEPIVFSDDGIDALVRICLAAAMRDAEDEDNNEWRHDDERL